MHPPRDRSAHFLKGKQLPTFSRRNDGCSLSTAFWRPEIVLDLTRFQEAQFWTFCLTERIGHSYSPESCVPPPRFPHRSASRPPPVPAIS